MTIWQAALIALLYWMCNNFLLGYFGVQMNWPVVHGFFIGLIMGDPVTGTILGGTIQTLNMAPSLVGFTVTMDMTLAGFITIPLAMATGMETDAVIAFAVPFTVLGTFLQPLLRTLNTVCCTVCDKAADEGNTKKYYFGSTILPCLISFPFRFLLLFVALYFGRNAMSALLAAVPEWLMLGFIALGKFLPAIGFAIFLASMNRKDLLPLFFIGFYAMYFFSSTLSILGLTIFAIIVAVMVIQRGLAKLKEEEKAV